MEKLHLNVKDFLVQIVGENNKDLIDSLTSEDIFKIESEAKICIKKSVKKSIFLGLNRDLADKKGERIEILDQFFKKTPFYYYYELVLDFHSKKCETINSNHLFYYVANDSDTHESSSIYRCAYCSLQREKSKRVSLEGDIANTTYKPGTKLKKANEILKRLNSQNLSNEEIMRFVDLIVNLAL